jgi:WD40 repeat protein
MDKMILVWSLSEPAEPVYTLIGHTDTVCALDVTPSGGIVSASWDKTARVWQDWKSVAELKGHEYAVWAVVAVNDCDILTGATLTKIGFDGSVRGQDDQIVAHGQVLENIQRPHGRCARPHIGAGRGICVVQQRRVRCDFDWR